MKLLKQILDWFKPKERHYDVGQYGAIRVDIEKLMQTKEFKQILEDAGKIVIKKDGMVTEIDDDGYCNRCHLTHRRYEYKPPVAKKDKKGDSKSIKE